MANQGRADTWRVASPAARRGALVDQAAQARNGHAAEQRKHQHSARKAAHGNAAAASNRRSPASAWRQSPARPPAAPMPMQAAARPNRAAARAAAAPARQFAAPAAGHKAKQQGHAMPRPMPSGQPTGSGQRHGQQPSHQADEQMARNLVFGDFLLRSSWWISNVDRRPDRAAVRGAAAAEHQARRCGGQPAFFGDRRHRRQAPVEGAQRRPDRSLDGPMASMPASPRSAEPGWRRAWQARALDTELPTCAQQADARFAAGARRANHPGAEPSGCKAACTAIEPCAACTRRKRQRQVPAANLCAAAGRAERERAPVCPRSPDRFATK
ncbi:hypothetical protein FQA39_LY19233 [Lamprigera yunnana]|nr:hypothetical protein FQA39_LY19233 [Lamprigera yunnana]